jgi:hypothetical protein
VETDKRDGDTSKILDGEDGKCAGYVAEVGERERRAEEGISTGRIASIITTLYGYIHLTYCDDHITQRRLKNGRGRTPPVTQSDASLCACLSSYFNLESL